MAEFYLINFYQFQNNRYGVFCNYLVLMKKYLPGNFCLNILSKNVNCKLKIKNNNNERLFQKHILISTYLEHLMLTNLTLKVQK